jgi:hypothetical protein
VQRSFSLVRCKQAGSDYRPRAVRYISRRVVGDAIRGSLSLALEQLDAYPCQVGRQYCRYQTIVIMAEFIRRCGWKNRVDRLSLNVLKPVL